MLDNLFSPIKIGKLEIKNRIVLPPMTLGYGMPGGTVTERHHDYYIARAKGGAGLIQTEAIVLNPQRTFGLAPLGLWEDEQIPGWKKLADDVHSYGTKLAGQLFDPGPECIEMLTGIQPAGPSAVPGASIFRSLPRELTTEEVGGVVNDFANAVARAKEAGLDMIEIHAAHGYAMVGSFLSPFLNKRTDKYGGSLEGRMQFLLEIIQASRDKVGRDFPLIVRMSGEERRTGGRVIHESQYIASILEDASIDGFEISGGTVPSVMWGVVAPSGTPLALNAQYSEAVKQVVDVPVICVGRINTPKLAEFIIKSGKADMVSMGRALNADPELPNKAAAGAFEDIAPCIACNTGCLGTVQSAGQSTCVINPEAGKEGEMAIVPAEKPKKVLIVGGGPAGLETARVAAIRGHDVTLYEKADKLGGQVNIASIPPFMQENSQLIKYLSTQVKKVGVKVNLDTEVDTDLIIKEKPDVAIVATGAQPIIPESLPGADKANVVTAWDTLKGNAATLAGNVIIVGGGLVGCETADFLAALDDSPNSVASVKVTILEMQDRVAMDSVSEPRHLLMQRLREKHVNIICNATVKEILDDGVLYVKDGKEETLKGAQFVILAAGVTSVNNLSAELEGKIDEVYTIGDASSPAKILQATAAAADIARKI